MKGSDKPAASAEDSQASEEAPVKRLKLPQRPAGSGFRSRLYSSFELALGIAIVGLLAVGIQAFAVKPYRIPSGSMEPTLTIGQRLVVNRIGMNLDGPHVGEIVVFHPPESAEQMICGSVRPRGAPCAQPVAKEDSSVNFIKRVVAGPGDEIYIKAGHAFRKAAGTTEFIAEKDSYIAPCSPASLPECNFPVAIEVPRGHWFVMGDNRGHSNDSRFWGPVPTGWMIGGALATFWPPDRIGFF